ncbi:hypothetical protein Ahy_B01g052623 [Arachis hypogaea]|uniref:Uncharacterized protein n=1 Tax=Arachis hypogaea TaxID=3818 RepID=A0A445APX0_ARAHY|nr:hypothetical protein Ahy_B01g052623 [Arachis hypogaea]
MAAIAKKGDRADTYAHKWLKMDAFRVTYGHSISQFNSEEYWEKYGEISSIPPKIKRTIGSPVKRRKPDPVEDGPKDTKAKKTFRVTCKKCGEPGKVKEKSKEKSFTTQEEIQVIQPETPINAIVLHVGMNVNAATTIIRPKSQESVNAETMAAVSSGTTSKMFKFIPTPKLNLSKKK